MGTVEYIGFAVAAAVTWIGMKYADRLTVAYFRALKLRMYREYRQWRDALHRAQASDDLDEGDRLCRIGPREYAIERANGAQ